MSVIRSAAIPNPECPNFFERPENKTRFYVRDLIGGLQTLHLRGRQYYPVSSSSATLPPLEGTRVPRPRLKLGNGVSASVLVEMAKHVPKEYSLLHVVEAIVIPASQKHYSSLVDIPGVLHSRYSGAPDVLVATSWDCNFHALVKAIVANSAGKPDQYYYWLEALSVTQHPTVKPCHALGDALLLAAKSASTGLAVLYEDFPGGGALGHSCALFLLWSVARKRGPKAIDVVHTSGFKGDSLRAQVRGHADNLNIEKAKSCNNALHAFVLQSINNSFSNPKTFDQALGSALCMAVERPSTLTRGVSLKGLRKLRLMIEADLIGTGRTFSKVNSLQELTTTDFVYGWVKDCLVTGELRLADIARFITPEDTGEPMYFISHAWKSTLGRLLDTVERALANASEDTCVWIDCLAVNQHAKSPENQADVAAFEEVIMACSGGTIVVVDMGNCNPSTRAWCLYEWDHTALHHGSDGLHMQGLSLEDRAHIIGSIDVDTAECFMSADKEMILSKVRGHHGSTQQFNNLLRLLLLLNPLSYRVDRQQLSQRSKDTLWSLQIVQQWVEAGSSGTRALCILAEAGIGKSTISDKICEDLLNIPRASGSYNTGAGCSTEGNSSASQASGPSPGTLAAAHFLKYSDNRRLNVCNIIKSLAFQLGTRSPVMADKLLSADTHSIVQLQDMEAAFKLLLKPLLDNLASEEQVILLFDALDEADPVEQQRMQQQLLQGHLDPIEAAKKLSVKAGGNKTLGMLLKYLIPSLPKNVRFIFTSRPDAVCGGIQDTLQRAFEEGVTFIDRPQDLTGGGEDGGEKSKVLVYSTVVKECKLTLEQPACPTLDHLYGAYTIVFDACCVSHRESKYLPLLRVLVAAQEPMSHAMLHNMGLAKLLKDLPGWGCLFYEADHRIYSLHKSLIDWLTLDELSNPRHSITASLCKGHAALGSFLAKSVVELKDKHALPSVSDAYTQNYLAHHLAEAQSLPCTLLLESVLSQWGFIQSLFQGAEAAAGLVRALGSILKPSPYIYDALRWLKQCFNDFEKDPQAMAKTTYRSCPTLSVKYREAVVALRCHPVVMTLGKSGDWPLDVGTFKGHTGSIQSVAFSPDGKQLATGSVDNTAKLWDLSSGQCTSTLEDGWTALIYAAASGALECVQALLEKGAYAAAKDNIGRTALMVAAYNGRLECVKALLEKGADTAATNNDGETALMRAAFMGHLECVQALLEKGADIDAKSHDGRTALMRAAYMGHLECFQALLEKGADIDAKSHIGRTALMVAAYNGRLECVKALLEKGADSAATNNDGETALMRAAYNGRLECVQALLEKGADIDAKSHLGWTALMWAARDGALECVQALLEKGADIDAKSNDGKTAYDRADTDEIKELLKTYMR